jgi:predicted nucleic acid-binding protein
LILYLDTSVWVALPMMQTGSAAARAFVQEREGEPVLVSDWTVAEYHCALARLRRAGEIDDTGLAAALEAFQSVLRGRMPVARVQRRDFEDIVRPVSTAGIAPRAGDALHIATARRLKATLVTLDRQQASSASAAGLHVLVPGQVQSTSSTPSGPPP